MERGRSKDPGKQERLDNYKAQFKNGKKKWVRYDEGAILYSMGLRRRNCRNTSRHSIPNLRWRKFFLIFLLSGRKSKTKMVDLTVDAYGFRVYNEVESIYGFRIQGGTI